MGNENQFFYNRKFLISGFLLGEFDCISLCLTNVSTTKNCSPRLFGGIISLVEESARVGSEHAAGSGDVAPHNVVTHVAHLEPLHPHLLYPRGGRHVIPHGVL